MERMEFTTVLYLIKMVMTRAHTLECTKKAQVSDTCIQVLMLQRVKHATNVTNKKSSIYYFIACYFI